MAIWGRHRRLGWRHAGDEALAFLAMAGFEAADPSLSAHVTTCTRCSLRLSALEQSLADDQRKMIAQSDQVFTPARLDRQRASILRRIGGSRAAARILPFPAHGPVAVTPRRQLVKRSIAAAAVAGLFLGAAAGRFIDQRRQSFRPARVVAEQRTLRPVSSVQTLQASVSAEEDFLRDYEAALEAARVEPLLALDAMTPSPADDWPAP